MKTPKQLFALGPHRKAHEEWTMTQAAEHAVMTALAQMETEMPETLADVSKSWDYGAQMIGARRFAEILLTLHVQQTDRKHASFPTLPVPK